MRSGAHRYTHPGNPMSFGWVKLIFMCLCDLEPTKKRERVTNRRGPARKRARAQQFRVTLEAQHSA
eukprot:6186637-Pleurochrysis_carterae.AAC.4